MWPRLGRVFKIIWADFDCDFSVYIILKSYFNTHVRTFCLCAKKQCGPRLTREDILLMAPNSASRSGSTTAKDRRTEPDRNGPAKTAVSVYRFSEIRSSVLGLVEISRTGSGPVRTGLCVFKYHYILPILMFFIQLFRAFPSRWLIQCVHASISHVTCWFGRAYTFVTKLTSALFTHPEPPSSSHDNENKEWRNERPNM